MLTKDDLEQIGALFKPIKEQLNAVEMKVEAVHEFNKKAHTEIMEALFEGNEANGKELKRLEKRIEKIEVHLHLPHSA